MKKIFLLILTISCLVFLILILGINIKKIVSLINNDSSVKEQSLEIATEIFGEQHVLHPYLGFVDNYGKENNINRFGFFGQEPVFKKQKNDYVIAITGGSVASLFYRKEGDYFKKQLENDPNFKDRNVILISLALAGYKQPQQLMVISYLLSLGAKFDAVINIDGFNEIALSSTENLPNGISSFYPRSWNIYALNIFNPDFLNQTKIIKNINKYKDELNKTNSLFDSPILNNLTFVKNYLIQENIVKIAQEQKKLELFNKKNLNNYQISGPEKLYLKKDYLVYQNIVNVWVNSSIQMSNLARSNGFLYFHFLQPNQYVLNTKTLSYLENKIAFNNDQPYKKAVEQFYPLLISQKDKLLESNVSFIDLTNIFKNIKEDIYIDNCCHYNDLGNRIIADRINIEIIKSIKNFNEKIK